MFEVVNGKSGLVYYIKDNKELYVRYNGIGYKVSVLDISRDSRGIKTPVTTVISRVKQGKAHTIIDLHSAMMPRFGLIKTNLSRILPL